jgi:SpoIID/LytB domain protein
LNDNTFRSALYFPSYDDLSTKHISIINILPIESYLAGVAEYSNSTKQEKIKTLAISARSYAYSYLGSQRKFDTHLYDASDNPEEFQLYLGYGYEQRSPRARSIVASTRGVILETPLWVPFRSWYSSSAGGQTRSYAQYCLDRGVTNCKSNPHLISVSDAVSTWSKRVGHGVWLTGDGSEYLANLWWSASEILAYYYRDLMLTKKW